MKQKLIAPCHNCGQETWNENPEWSGFCSKTCELHYKYDLDERHDEGI